MISSPMDRGARVQGRSKCDMAPEVAGTVTITRGSNNIKVKFDGGESDLILDPGVPVTAIVPIERDVVKPGAKVRVQGTKTVDESVINRITLQ